MFGSKSAKEQAEHDRLVDLEQDLRERMHRNERGAREQYVEQVPAGYRKTVVVPTKDEVDAMCRDCYPSDRNDDGTSRVTEDWNRTLEARRAAWERRFPDITKWRAIDPNSGGDAAGATGTTAPTREATMRAFTVDPVTEPKDEVEVLWRAPRLRLEREGDEIRLVFIQPNPQHAAHWTNQLLAQCRRGVISMALEVPK